MAITESSALSPSLGTVGLRGVLFDMDGTLYVQRPVRARMAAELVAFIAANPRAGLRTAQVLAAYRHAQESLRGSHVEYDAGQQLAVVVERTGVHHDEATRIVDEWMFERPLKHLPRHKAKGVSELLERLAGKGVQLGVLSDYAAGQKLRALGVERWFSQVLCAGDPEVRALKPAPRGFLVACERWQFEPSQVLMVGDRVDVDAAGATAAGMRSVIIGRRPSTLPDPQTTFVSSLEQVRSVIDERC